jgi:hypothetical protein
MRAPFFLLALALALVATCAAAAQDDRSREPVEPRPKLRRAEELLREEAARYFAPEAVTSGAVIEAVRGAIARAAEEAGASATLVALLPCDPKTTSFPPFDAPPAPFLATRLRCDVRGAAAADLAGFLRGIERDRRIIADLAILGRGRDGSYGGELHVLALAVDANGRAGEEAQAALDTVRNFDCLRVHIAPIVEAAFGLLPEGAAIRVFAASPRSVEIALDSARPDTAKSYAELLAEEPAFGPYSEPEVREKRGGGGFEIYFRPENR